MPARCCARRPSSASVSDVSFRLPLMEIALLLLPGAKKRGVVLAGVGKRPLRLFELGHYFQLIVFEDTFARLDGLDVLLQAGELLWIVEGARIELLLQGPDLFGQVVDLPLGAAETLLNLLCFAFPLLDR